MPSALLSLPHSTPLIEARFLARYQRFIAEVAFAGGERAFVHCVNPGRMEGLLHEGARIWVSEVPPDSTRKLRFTWELIEVDEVIVGANTAAPNGIAEALLEARVLPGVKRYRRLQREVAYGERSRVDFCLEQGKVRHYIEVKNCHLVYPDDRGYFPDSPSKRATHHLEELANVVREGQRATVLFTVQHPHAVAVRPSTLHDPDFAAAARRVSKLGVAFRAVRIEPTTAAYVVREEIPVDLGSYDVEPIARWRQERLPFGGWKRQLPAHYPR